MALNQIVGIIVSRVFNVIKRRNVRELQQAMCTCLIHALSKLRQSEISTTGNGNRATSLLQEPKMIFIIQKYTNIFDYAFY